VSDYAWRLFRELHGAEADLPPAFVDAQTLTPGDHLVMQAAAQKYIDSSISKTINLPEQISFEAFRDIYRRAWDLGCKGCTTYRPNTGTGAVLETAAPTSGQAEPPAQTYDDVYEAGGVVYMTQPLDRPAELPGRTYKIRWPDSDHAIYITVNDIVRDSRRVPFEVFINSKNMEHYVWTVALTRMISAVFRRGGGVSFVVEELKAVFDPRGGQWMGGRYVPSQLAAIGEVIEQHMVAIGFLPESGLAEIRQPIAAVAAGSADTNHLDASPLRQCPKCGGRTLTRQEDCDICLDCTYSKCG
jgi:ribonucleoside-diphosphate reductase alpha chain